MQVSMELISSLIDKMAIWVRSPAGKIVPQMRSEIKECLEAEKNMEDLISPISETETRENAINKIMLYIPCVMYLENHVDIKIVTMLLIEGMSNVTEGRI